MIAEPNYRSKKHVVKKGLDKFFIEEEGFKLVDLNELTEVYKCNIKHLIIPDSNKIKPTSKLLYKRIEDGDGFLTELIITGSRIIIIDSKTDDISITIPFGIIKKSNIKKDYFYALQIVSTQLLNYMEVN